MAACLKSNTYTASRVRGTQTEHHPIVHQPPNAVEAPHDSLRLGSSSLAPHQTPTGTPLPPHQPDVTSLPQQQLPGLHTVQPRQSSRPLTAWENLQSAACSQPGRRSVEGAYSADLWSCCRHGQQTASWLQRAVQGTVRQNISQTVTQSAHTCSFQWVADW
jgi:hypothetical protein